ncbi:trypsin-like peptidase domain-containing protein [uncultured Winogradskyella sp.]|uniref:S1 family peptidase n=1 Tax=uncultured Winogradskyella sp. TaxID=395353 RepID=UPI0035160359
MKSIKSSVVILLAFLCFTNCEKKPPEPKELYNTYRSSVVLIKNAYYFKMTLDNGIEIFYTINNDEPLVYDDEISAMNNASTIYGTGFFISDKGEIATNRHVIYPSKAEQNMGRFIIQEFIKARKEIREEIDSKTSTQGETENYFNNYYDYLSEKDKEDLRNLYARLENDIDNLEYTLGKLDFDPKKTQYEIKRVFTGILYDDHHVTSEDDYDECVPLKRSNEELSDLAIIQLKNKKTPDHVSNYLSINKNITPPQLEDKVYLIGYNSGLLLAQTNDGVKTQFTSGKITQDPDSDRILYSIPTLTGSSGGPVINEWGELVAVNFAKMRDYQGFSFGVPKKKLELLYTDNTSYAVNERNSNYPRNNSAQGQNSSEYTSSGSSNSNIDYHSIINNFLEQEDSRNFSSIYNFYSPNIKRYWNVDYPSYEQLFNQYKKAWNTTEYSKNNVQNIEKLTENKYVVSTQFKFLKNGASEISVVNSRIYFEFDYEGKIISIYGL